MWQQMLILILLVWIVGASVVPTVAVTTMRIEATSSTLPNRNNNSVILSEKNVERKNLSGSAPEQQKGGNTTGNVTESSGSSDSSEVIRAPDQSESKSLVQKDHISKDKNTESPNTTIDRGNLTEVSSYPLDVKEPNNNTTVDSDTKADNIQNNRDLEPNDTDHKVGKGNDQEDNENTDKQSNISSVGDPYLLVGDESGQTSNNTSEKEKEGNIIKMVSTTESSGSSGSLDSPPLDKTIQVEYPKLPKKPSTSTTTTTTVAADISNEEYQKSPIQGMDEIGDVDNSSQSSAMKNVPVSDEKHDIQDLQEGKEGKGCFRQTTLNVINLQQYNTSVFIIWMGNLQVLGTLVGIINGKYLGVLKEEFSNCSISSINDSHSLPRPHCLIAATLIT